MQILWKLKYFQIAVWVGIWQVGQLLLNYIEIRSNLNSVDDIKHWVNEHGSLKNTHSVSRSSILFSNSCVR